MCGPPRKHGQWTWHLLSFARGEGEEFFHEFIRPLDVRKMPSTLDPLEAGAGNGGAIGSAVLLAENAIMDSPQKQCRDADAVQPALELGVVHERRPGVACGRFPAARGIAHLRLRHGFVVAPTDIGVVIGDVEKVGLGHGEDVRDIAMLAAADLYADRVAQHEMGNSRCRLDCDLGCDPAAERYAYQRDVREVELMHEVEVEIGEVVDAIEGFWRLRAAEAGMGRNNHPGARGEPLEHGSIGLDANPGMKEEQWPTRSA